MAKVLWLIAAIGVVAIVVIKFAGGSDGGSSQNALQVPTERPAGTVRPAGSTTPSAGILNPTPQATGSPASQVAGANATPGATRLPDRTSCGDIRGTDYRSDSERAFYIANCSPTPGPAGNGGGLGGSQSQALGPAPTATATPTQGFARRHLFGYSDGQISADVAYFWQISSDKFVLTLTILPGLQLLNGDPLNSQAVANIILDNRLRFDATDNVFVNFSGNYTVTLRNSGTIDDAFLDMLASIEVVVKAP